MQKLIILFSFIGLCTLSHGQNTAMIESAFSSGQATKLSGEMAKEIELCIGTEVEFYSASQAIQALNKWFGQVKVSAVSGKIVGGSAVKYYNGDIKSEKGAFRLFVYYNEKGGTFKIDEIRITSK